MLKNAASVLMEALIISSHRSEALVQESAPRTLFVTHLDAFTTEAQLQKSFSSFGPVEPLGFGSCFPCGSCGVVKQTTSTGEPKHLQMIACGESGHHCEMAILLTFLLFVSWSK